MLPSPSSVVILVWQEMQNGQLWYHLSATLLRVLISFIIAMLIGSIIGIIMGRSRITDQFLDPWLIIFLNIPALVIIILAYVWFGLEELTAIFAIAINKIPNVIVTMREGARTLDEDYNQMARSFNLSRRKILFYITLPQLLPFFAVAARSGIALIWKIVLVVELLGRSNGVGFQLHLYFQLFDVTGIMAYSFSFILIMLTIEYALLQPLERKINRWRG
ncbi:MAG: ABC transporter permease [gamma proteobacterium symbiont of Stewartia floridana]|nr:MAG: ABC transporter permease [gamma proteobacterium symbiont of Stewartia floridana]